LVLEPWLLRWKKPNVLARGLAKIVFKKCEVGKNKKHWFGLNVGSNVLLKYGL